MQGNTGKKQGEEEKHNSMSNEENQLKEMDGGTGGGFSN